LSRDIHDANAKYLGISLVSIIGLAVSVWGLHLNYHPPASPSFAPTANNNRATQLPRTQTSYVSRPNPVSPREDSTPLILPSQPAAKSPIPRAPTWGYSFPNVDGLYSVRLEGFPEDLDDASIRSLIKDHLLARLELGEPTSVITFRANLDSNRQSDQCTSMNGVSAVIDFRSERSSDQDSNLFKRGQGFACYGSDGKIAELEALGQAFANMRN